MPVQNTAENNAISLIVANLDSSEPVEYLIMQLISRYGIKSAHDVLAFLHSPTGESIVHMIKKDLEAIASIEEYVEFEMLEADRAKERMLAFLMLYLANLKESRAETIEEFIQEQIDKLLHKQHKDHEEEHDHEMMEKEAEALDAYSEFLNKIAEQQQEELETLDEELRVLEEEGEALEQNHQSLLKHIVKLDTLSEELSQLDLPHEEMQARIEQEINQLEKKIPEYTKLAAQYEEEGQDQKVAEIKNKIQGRELRIQGLQDYLKKHAEKGHDDKAGAESSSVKDPVLSLRPNESLKVVKDAEGKLYLIDRNKELDDLSPNQKHDANKRYEVRAQTPSVQQDARKYIGLSLEAHAKSLSAIDDRFANLQKQISETDNQKLHVQSALATLQPLVNAGLRPGLAPNVQNLPINRTSASNAPVNAPDNQLQPRPMPGGNVNPIIRNRNIRDAQNRLATTLKRNIIEDLIVEKQNIITDVKVEKQNLRHDMNVEAQNNLKENREKEEAEYKSPTPFDMSLKP